MDSKLKLTIFLSWVFLLDKKILSAIAATPNQSIPDTIQDDFEFIGNILEALGTAVASEEDATALIRTGEILEIIGNIEVAASTLTDNRKLQKLLRGIATNCRRSCHVAIR